jgi:hypothetical protein
MCTKAAPRALQLPKIAENAIKAKASQRALHIPEVLEHILVHLPIKDLFVHQRVSRTFQRTIAESPAIRKKMFMALDTKAPRETWSLAQNRKKRGRGRNRWYFYPGTDDEPRITIPVTLNPILEVAAPGMYGYASCAQRKEDFDAENVRLKARDYDIDSDSSLLAMYVSDPPCRDLTVSFEFGFGLPSQLRGFYSGSVKLQSETGLKLGDLWDGALGASLVFRQEDNGTYQQGRVVKLRPFLDELGNPRDAVQSLWFLELNDVFVPTDKEWTDVKRRDARR